MPESASVIEFFFTHFIITLIGGGAGILIGGGIGLLLGHGLERLYAQRPRWLRFAILFPWRTLLFGLLVPPLLTVLIVVRAGLGNTAAAISLFILMTALAVAMVAGVLVRRRFPATRRVELVSAARTLITGGVVLLATITGTGAGNLGTVILQQMRIMDYETVTSAYLYILLALLIFDLGFGVVQSILVTRESADRPYNSAS